MLRLAYRMLVMGCVAALMANTAVAQESEPEPPVVLTMADYRAAEREFQDALLLKMQSLVDWPNVNEAILDLTARLHHELGCEVVVEEQALDDLGMTVEDEVHGSFRQVSLQHALEHLLGQHDLEWTLRGRMLVITSEDQARQELLVRVYDVSDLVEHEGYPDIDFDTLIDVIVSTIDADTWAENGGGEAEVRPYESRQINALVVSQTFRTHQKLEKLLEDLRGVRRSGPSPEESAKTEKAKKVLGVLGGHVQTTLQFNLPDFKEAIARSNDFSFELFRKAATERDRNQMLSGYGAREMLALAACGAEGTTQEELTKALGLPPTRGEIAQQMMVMRTSVGSRRRGSVLNVANGIWLDRRFELDDEFNTLATNLAQATVQQVDFRDAKPTAKRMNDWIGEHTKGQIAPIFNSNSANVGEWAPCVLLNAVYFKGEWHDPFSSHNTEPKPFHLASGETVDVPTMHGYVEGQIARDDEQGATIAELYYANKSKSMLLVVPDKEEGRLEQLEAALSAKQLEHWTRSLKQSLIHVALPKFEFNERFELIAPLKELGIHEAFQLGKADFSKLVPQGMQLGIVRQYTYVRVDEKGTEAVALSGGAFGGPRIPPSDLKIDRPFLFLIRDVRTGCVLFTGRVADPREAGSLARAGGWGE